MNFLLVTSDELEEMHLWETDPNVRKAIEEELAYRERLDQEDE